MKMPIREVMYRCGIIVLVLCVALIGLIFYWRLVPSDVNVIKGKVLVRPTIVNQGDVLIVTLDYCKKINAKGITKRSLVSNTRVVILPDRYDASPKGCYKIEYPVLVPNPLSSDTYVIHYETTYQVNPARTTTEIFNTEAFTVNGLPPSNSSITPATSGVNITQPAGSDVSSTVIDKNSDPAYQEAKNSLTQPTPTPTARQEITPTPSNLNPVGNQSPGVFETLGRCLANLPACI